MAGIGNYVHYWYSNYQEHGITEKDVSNSNYQSVYAQQKSKILNKFKKSTNNYIKLENALNNLVYPIGEKALDTRSDFQLEAIMAETALKYVVKLGQQKGSAQQRSIGTKSFQASTVLNLKNQVENVYNMLLKSKNVKNLETRVNNLKMLSQQINNLYNTIPNDLKTSNRKIQVDDVNREYILDINQKLIDISKETKQQAIGKAFEASIAKLDDHFNTSVENYSYDFIEKILVGNKTSSVHGAEISTTYVDSDGAKISLKQMAGQFSGEFMKTDINLTYDNEQYRISAKSYGFLQGYSVNLLTNSPLLNILQKSANTDFINHYLNAATARQKNNKIDIKSYNASHEIAKLTILAEALSGLNQQQGNADFFVLNNRAKKRVTVKPIEYFLNPMKENLFNIKNYDLPNKWYQYNKWIGQKGSQDQKNARQRITNLISELHENKITVQLRANNI